MKRLYWIPLLLLPGTLSLTGCGRPTLPGGTLAGQRTRPSVVEPRSEAPKQPYIEAGSPDAKVRVMAFFAIDSRHKPVIDAVKDLPKQYPGKVYVKYVDPDTPRGREIMANAKATGNGVLVNGETTVQQGSSTTKFWNFGGEMGRYWTAEDLKAAVAQEVQKVYGKQAGGVAPRRDRVSRGTAGRRGAPARAGGPDPARVTPAAPGSR